MVEIVVGSENEKSVRIEGMKWYPPELIPKTARITPKKRMLSVPSRVLAEAGVDVSRALYGKWVIDNDNIRLEISYERTPGFQKLTRMNPSPCRLIYLPSKLRKILKADGIDTYFWFAEDNNTLRFVPVKNRVTIRKFLGVAVRKGESLSVPHILIADHCILGFSEDFILAIPDDTYGVGVELKGGRTELDLKPLPAIKWHKWQCWEGFAEIAMGSDSIKRECIVLFPVETQ